MTKKIMLHKDESKRIQFVKISVALANVYLDKELFCTVKLADAERIQNGLLPHTLRYVMDWSLMIQFMDAVEDFIE